MRKLVIILIGFIAVATFLRAYDTAEAVINSANFEINEYSILP